MFLFSGPSGQWITRLLDARRDALLSYDEVGVSREAPKGLAGYVVDHNRTRLREGRDTLDRAVAALHAWKMFDIGWARLVPEGAPIEVGTMVAMLAWHYGFLSLTRARSCTRSRTMTSPA